MKRLFKYLKPYTLILILCIALLFGRAMADLELPNRMSDIVNNGIQLSGITEKAPKEMSDRAMTLMTAFMPADAEKTFRDAYTADGEKFVLIDTKNEAVGDIFGRSASAMVSFFKEFSEQSGQEINLEDTEETALDIEQIYQILPMLSQIPPEMLKSYYSTEDSAVIEQMGTQVGAIFIKAFYQEIAIDTEQIQQDYILKTGLSMLLITLGGVVASVLNGLLSSRIGAAFSRDVRRAIFEKVERFSGKEFDKFSTASLITRTTNDVTQVQMLITMGLRILCYAPIMGVGGVIFALQKGSTLSWIIATAVGVLLLLIVLMYNLVVPKFKILQKQTDEINLVSRENLSGVMVIRAFGNEQVEEERFDGVNGALAKTNLWIFRVMAFAMPLMMLLMNVVMVGIIWFGGQGVAAATIQIGDMMAFMQYAMQIIMSFLLIAMMFIMVPRASVSGRRIAEVLDSPMIINDPEPPKTLRKSDTRTVAFNNVTFRYGRSQEPVLHNISFTAKPGQMTAIIGATGSGKSSLVNLIPRLYDVTEGNITIDGTDIRDITQHELREEIGFIPQKGILFSGTIAENIRYGRPDATEQEIAQALSIAQAADFVGEYEDKTEHLISQGGSNVSGGQRQRLSIARALVKRAPIYIFDDSFSALDFKTDAALRKALRQNLQEATLIVVAQRVSTVMQAEQIIVLEDGAIAGIGTHKELLQSCETYREIASSQLTKEEM